MSGPPAREPDAATGATARPVRVPGAVSAFVDRVGGVLVSPRATLARVAAGEGGLDDVLALLLLRVIASEPDRIARAALSVEGLGALGAVQGLVSALSTVLPDALAILVGGFLLGIVARLARRGGAAVTRELDLAAVAWIPAIVVHLGVLFAHHVAGVALSGGARAALQGVGLVWAFGCWLISLRLLVDGGAASSEDPSRASGTSA